MGPVSTFIVSWIILAIIVSAAVHAIGASASAGNWAYLIALLGAAVLSYRAYQTEQKDKSLMALGMVYEMSHPTA